MRHPIALLSLLILLFLHPLQTLAAVKASGKCGDKLEWILDDTGLLRITGSGQMTEFESEELVSWYRYRDEITEVSLPDGLTSIAPLAFYYCRKMQKVNLPETVTSIGKKAFSDCYELTALTLPNSVTTIGTEAFSRCSRLESVNIPAALTKILSSTFWQCSELTTIVLPETIVSIGNFAFAYCTKLTTLVCLATAPPTVNVNSAFLNVPVTEGTLYVPDSSVKSYLNDTNWNDRNSGKSWGQVLPISYLQFTVTAEAEAGVMGTVSGGGTYRMDAVVTLTATANPGYEFISWSDGSTSNPYTFKATQDVSLKAIFKKLPPSDDNPGGETGGSGDDNPGGSTGEGGDDNPGGETGGGGDDNPGSGTGGGGNDNPGSGTGGSDDHPGNDNGKILNITDGTDYSNLPGKTYESLAYTRQFSMSGQWEALSIPMSINVADYLSSADFGEIYAIAPCKDTNGDGKVDGQDDFCVIVRKMSKGELHPNTPYFIRPAKNGELKLQSGDNRFHDAKTMPLSISVVTRTYSFVPLKQSRSLNGKDEYLLDKASLSGGQGARSQVSSGRWVMSIADNTNGNSSLPNEVRLFTLDEDVMEKTVNGKQQFFLMDDMETAIAPGIRSDEYGDTGVYTLDGRKMPDGQRLQPGIYLMNGKKIYVSHGAMAR